MLSENGKHRESKASKKKHKLKQVKCSCGEITNYEQEDIQHMGKIFYVTCDWCGKDIKIDR